MSVTKLEIVPLREAFRYEAHSFTTWLENNIEALSERIGIELTVLEREKSVGSFSVDLLCEDQDGSSVIIENQLERTDHDHLGKLLTYMVNLGAKTAIWVAAEARQEHQRVIDWLNESTAADTAFYLVKVEAIRIEDSPYAPLFTVLAQPDAQTREIGEEKKELAERHILREQFWTQLLERSKPLTNLTANRSAPRDHWLDVAAGRSGIHYDYHILKDHVLVGLYIDVSDYTRNKQIFDAFLSQKDQIEAEFGEPLEWRRLDDRQASRVIWSYTGHGGLFDQENWGELQDRMIKAMIRLDRVMRKRIRDVGV